MKSYRPYNWATHNSDSIKNAISQINTDNKDRICFAQLYGLYDFIADHIRQGDHQTYKYVPYGDLDTLIPYITRRMDENKYILQDNKKNNTELQILENKLKSGLIRIINEYAIIKFVAIIIILCITTKIYLFVNSQITP